MFNSFRLNIETTPSPSRSKGVVAGRGRKRKRLEVGQEEYEYTTSDSAKGEVRVMECDPEGKFVKLQNISDKVKFLFTWQLVSNFILYTILIYECICLEQPLFDSLKSQYMRCRNLEMFYMKSGEPPPVDIWHWICASRAITCLFCIHWEGAIFTLRNRKIVMFVYHHINCVSVCDFRYILSWKLLPCHHFFKFQVANEI